MSIKEIREIIKKYDRKDLENIIVELYKRIPKAKKEDYDIDGFITNLNKKEPKKETEDFGVLIKEINYFLSCVDNDLYCSPNRIISKKERSGWRFKTKKYYKELTKIDPNSVDGKTATNLLIELYKRLSKGVYTLLFVNWDTFKALGVNQYAYYNMLLQRMFSKEITNEDIKKSIELLKLPNDGDVLKEELYDTLIFNYLKDDDYRLEAVDILKEKILEYQKELNSSKNRSSSYIYMLEKNIDEHAKSVAKIYLLLNKIDMAISYFNKNHTETRKEVKEYILLEDVLDILDDKSIWIKEYEKNIGKINYRDELVEKYKKYKTLIEK